MEHDAPSELPSKAEEILPLVYEELRRLAHSKMSGEACDNTLQTTALVHEAFMKVTRNRNGSWRSERDFVAAAAQAMRRILVDRARSKRRLRRGGDRQRVAVDNMDQYSADERANQEIVNVDDALKALEESSPELSTLVKLRYFAGLSLEEAGQVLGLSRATAYRQWNYARALLMQIINRQVTNE